MAFKQAGDEARGVRLAFDSGGSGGGELVVLLHGLGATAGVWTPLTARLHARWVAIDLPGHGGSDPLGGYDLDDYAAELVPLIVKLAAGAPVALVGHSLGGSVALSIAGLGGGRWTPAAALALGVKIDWNDAELDRFAALAVRPPRHFITREEALAQHRRMCGLGDVDLDSPLLARGVREEDGDWRVAMDSRAFAVQPPPVERMVAEAHCPVHLACGVNDPMVGLARLRQFDSGSVAFPGAGHNAMIDAPDAIAGWLADAKRR